MAEVRVPAWQIPKMIQDGTVEMYGNQPITRRDTMEDRTITVTDDERQEVSSSLDMRRQDLKKERKRLVDRGLGAESVDEALKVHQGDGVSGGLTGKFAEQDNTDLFESPTPDGKVLVRLLKGKRKKATYLHLEDEAGCQKEIQGALPRWFPDPSGDPSDVDVAPLLVDENGELFAAWPRLTLDYEYMGSKCQEDSCWAPASRSGFCSTHYVIPEGEEEDTTEADPAEEIARQKRDLAAQIIRDSGDLSDDRKDMLLDFLQEAPEDWVEGVLELGPSGKMPGLPSTWARAQVDVYAGLSFSKVAELLAREWEVPREYLEGKGTGQNGKLTKGNVEDAHNAHISAEARAAGEGTTAEEAQETIEEEGLPNLELVE